MQIKAQGEENKASQADQDGDVNGINAPSDPKPDGTRNLFTLVKTARENLTEATADRFP